MTNGQGSRYGIPPQVANDAIDILSLYWTNRDLGPEIATIFFGASGLTPGQFVSIQLFPSGKARQEFIGPDGNISDTINIVNSGDDKTYDIAGGGSFTLPEGFWASQIRSVLAYDAGASPNATCWFVIQTGGFDPHNPEEFTVDETLDPPTDPALTEPVYDPELDQWVFDLSWTNQEPELGTLIEVQNSQIYQEGSVPIPDELYHERFTNEDPPDLEWIFRFYHYVYSPTRRISPPSDDLILTLGPTPPIDINHVMSGGLSIGGSATIFLLTDPSGIYKLVPGKTHDTIINRANEAGDAEEFDVKIPEPFAETGYL